MSKGQFYQTTDNRGKKLMFNINNVALMVADVFGTKITLNVKNEEGNFIEFISKEEFKTMSNNVMDIDEDQCRRKDSQEDI